MTSKQRLQADGTLIVAGCSETICRDRGHVPYGAGIGNANLFAELLKLSVLVNAEL